MKDYTQRRLSIEEIERAYPEAYEWAREFHNLYEETAPMFGYETRQETKEFDSKSPNIRLMAYVCFNLIAQAISEERERCVEVVKSWSPTDYNGYGLQAGGGLVKGMTIDDHKRTHAKQIIEAISPTSSEKTEIINNKE